FHFFVKKRVEIFTVFTSGACKTGLRPTQRGAQARSEGFYGKAQAAQAALELAMLRWMALTISTMGMTRKARTRATRYSFRSTGVKPNRSATNGTSSTTVVSTRLPSMALTTVVLEVPFVAD